MIYMLCLRDAGGYLMTSAYLKYTLREFTLEWKELAYLSLTSSS